MSANSDIEVILFDLGGVLVELDTQAANTTWFHPELSLTENWQAWLTSPFTQSFERGEISPHEFATQFLGDNNIDLSVDTFLGQFKSWVVGFYPGAFTLLDQLAGHYKLGVFSNITEVHWPDISQKLEANGRIEHYFASYQLGMAKPDPQSFNYVAEQLGVIPSKILFVDDNALNVQGARTAGLTAEVTRGYDQLVAVLKRRQIIDSRI